MPVTQTSVIVDRFDAEICPLSCILWAKHTTRFAMQICPNVEFASKFPWIQTCKQVWPTPESEIPSSRILFQNAPVV